MSLKFPDVSHWQLAINWKQFNYPVVIIKCSEGLNYVDTRFAQNKSNARNNNILLGYYHFAKGNDPKKEANFFVDSVGDIKKGEFLALDYEIHLKDPVSWCKTFLDEVTKLVGFKPLIYINSSTAQSFNWDQVINGNYGLWIASYGLNIPVIGIKTPKIGNWPFYAIWQYTSRGRVSGIVGNTDLNYTKMSLETLKKYGKK